MRLKDKIIKFPKKPWVYVFSKNGKVLYIGRATRLRDRVANYFRKDIDSRIAEMVSMATKLEYHETDSLLEAIILEANLIKKYWPKYNIKDKDHRSFVYIVIPLGHGYARIGKNNTDSHGYDYPRPFIVRGRELKKFPVSAKVFGPYQSYYIVRHALKIIRRIFAYSTCKPCVEALDCARAKPCFDYQIGLCPGACIGAISPKDYQKNIDNLVLFLKGEKNKLLKKTKKENPDLAKHLQHIHDVALISSEYQVSSIKYQRAYQAGRIEGYDISHLAGKETFGSMVVFINGEADKREYRLFKIKSAPSHDDLRALQEVLSRRLNHQEWPFPNLIMIDGGRPQIQFVEKLFADKNVQIPFVGISKYGGDKLVFPKNLKPSQRDLIKTSYQTLLKVREEAHRFAIRASRNKRKGLFINNQKKTQ